MTELKPCPFCGCKETTHAIFRATAWVECAECRMYGPTAGSAEEAIAAWDRRASATMGQVPERMEAPSELTGLARKYAEGWNACIDAMHPEQTGWKLVPVEPTPEILAELFRNERDAPRAWRDAIAAAPTPPATSADDARDAERYRWLEGRYCGWDAEWGDPAKEVIVFRFDSSTEVPMNKSEVGATIDAAIAAAPQDRGGREG